MFSGSNFSKFASLEYCILTCTAHTCLISYTLHIILLHVHLNKHTQRALYFSVNCLPLHSTYPTFHPNHKLMAKASPDLACVCFYLCIILASHVNFMYHSLYGTPCTSGKGSEAISSMQTRGFVESQPLHPF